jgi:hypothetical protein
VATPDRFRAWLFGTGAAADFVPICKANFF